MTRHSQQTQDPEVIRRWAEARDGRPARVRSTASDGPAHTGVLRIDFPGGTEDALEPIDWETFARTFREQSLTFVYEDRTADGAPSRFGKVVRSHDR